MVQQGAKIHSVDTALNFSYFLMTVESVLAQFKSVDGQVATGPPLTLPVNITPEQLEIVLNQLLNNVGTI